MKTKTLRKSHPRAVQSASFAAVLGLAAEIVRRVSENITKVQLQPLPASLIATGANRSAQAGVRAAQT